MQAERSERGARGHLIQLEDLGSERLEAILRRAADLKGGRGAPGGLPWTGRSLGMLFFRGSLRTRVSVEAAIQRLGGQTINLTASSDAWELEERDGATMDGRAPEHIKDAARVLSGYVDALAVRPAVVGSSWDLDRRDGQIAAWAQHAQVPVINMESALWHPLQALADLLTLRETYGTLAGKRLTLAWVHSPKPASVAVAHSLLTMAAAQGMQVRVAHPPGFELDELVIQRAREGAKAAGGSLEFSHQLEAAVAGAHVVYARSWGSLEAYGNPTLAASRRARHTDWRIDERLLAQGERARLMHAMPVRRNLEVSDEVLDGPRSLVYAQAQNRLHSQMALFSALLQR